MANAEQRRAMKPHQWMDGAGRIQSERWLVIEVKDVHDMSSPKVECREGYFGTAGDARDALQRIADDWGRERRLAIAQVFIPDIEIHQATVTWHHPERKDDGK